MVRVAETIKLETTSRGARTLSRKMWQQVELLDRGLCCITRR